MPSWIEALRQWNTTNSDGKWCIPRKGSTAYQEVRNLMGPQGPKKKNRT